MKERKKGKGEKEKSKGKVIGKVITRLKDK